MNDWKLLGSKIVFDKFMQVEERTYEMPDGKTKNFYIKITNPAICVLALTEDNKVITVEQFRPDSAKDKYAGTWAIRQLFDEGDD